MYAIRSNMSLIAGILLLLTSSITFAQDYRLGDRVWEDEDVDGIQDCADTSGNGIIGDTGDIGPECGNGIPNLTVEAYDPGGDGVCNTGDDVPLGLTTMTDIGGFYGFDNLTLGTYCVQFTLPSDDFCRIDNEDLGSPVFTLPNIGNDIFDSDADPTTGRTGNIILAANASDLTNDAGIVCPAKLGDRVWLDDGDGVQNCSDSNNNGIVGDAGDVGPECGSGIENIDVELVECGSDGMAGTIDDNFTSQIRFTDSMGFYMFGGEPGIFELPPGSYYIIAALPDGIDFTTPGIGNDAFDSDCGPEGQSMCVALGSGDIDRTSDCGVRLPPPPECDLLISKTCSIGSLPPGPGDPFPTADMCSFTGDSANVTYGYTVTNNGGPMTDVVITDDLLGIIGGPVDLGIGDSAQFTSSTMIFGTTTNTATSIGNLANGDVCSAMDTLTVEQEIPPDDDNDNIPNNVDVCPATVIPESLPTRSLGVNRFALVDGDDVFDTKSPKGRGPQRNYTTADTAGCSCTQIIDAQGLGNGHIKFGCSISVMDDWVLLMNP